jgi:hypothetical protein
LTNVICRGIGNQFHFLWKNLLAIFIFLTPWFDYNDVIFAPKISTIVKQFLIEIFNCTSGPVMTKFTIALREIGTYKEVLRSQVKYYVSSVFLIFSLLPMTPNNTFNLQTSVKIKLSKYNNTWKPNHITVFSS